MSFEVQQSGAEIVIRVRTDAAPADALVAIARAPLAALGLEVKPILRLIAEGKLKTVEIGRRRFTKQSFLLALVDALPAAKAVDAGDDLAVAAQKRAAKRVRS